MDETTLNKVVTVGNLGTFLDALLAKISNEYLTIAGASEGYAPLEGNIQNAFAVKTLSIYGQNGSAVFGVNSSGVMISKGNNYITIPITSGEVALTSNTASVHTAEDEYGNAAKFVVTPYTNVLRKAYTTNSSSNYSQVLTSRDSVRVGDLIYFKSGSFADINSDGIYMVKTDIHGDYTLTKDDLTFVVTPSVYSIYYSIDNRSFYRYSGANMISISVGSSGVIPSDGDYLPADDEDIQALFDAYSLPTESEDDEDNTEDTNE